MLHLVGLLFNTIDPFQATEVASASCDDYAVTYRQQCWASPCTPVDNWIAVWMGLAVQKKPASAGNQGTVIQTENFF